MDVVVCAVMATGDVDATLSVMFSVQMSSPVANGCSATVTVQTLLAIVAPVHGTVLV